MDRSTYIRHQATRAGLLTHAALGLQRGSETEARALLRMSPIVEAFGAGTLLRLVEPLWAVDFGPMSAEVVASTSGAQDLELGLPTGDASERVFHGLARRARWAAGPQPVDALSGVAWVLDVLARLFGALRERNRSALRHAGDDARTRSWWSGALAGRPDWSTTTELWESSLRRGVRMALKTRASHAAGERELTQGALVSMLGELPQIGARLINAADPAAPTRVLRCLPDDESTRVGACAASHRGLRRCSRPLGLPETARSVESRWSAEEDVGACVAWLDLALATGVVEACVEGRLGHQPLGAEGPVLPLGWSLVLNGTLKEHGRAAAVLARHPDRVASTLTHTDQLGGRTHRALIRYAGAWVADQSSRDEAGQVTSFRERPLYAPCTLPPPREQGEVGPSDLAELTLLALLRGAGPVLWRWVDDRELDRAQRRQLSRVLEALPASALDDPHAVGRQRRYTTLKAAMVEHRDEIRQQMDRVAIRVSEAPTGRDGTVAALAGAWPADRTLPTLKWGKATSACRQWLEVPDDER